MLIGLYSRVEFYVFATKHKKCCTFSIADRLASDFWDEGKVFPSVGLVLEGRRLCLAFALLSRKFSN